MVRREEESHLITAMKLWGKYHPLPHRSHSKMSCRIPCTQWTPNNTPGPFWNTSCTSLQTLLQGVQNFARIFQWQWAEQLSVLIWRIHCPGWSGCSRWGINARVRKTLIKFPNAALNIAAATSPSADLVSNNTTLTVMGSEVHRKISETITFSHLWLILTRHAGLLWCVCESWPPVWGGLDLIMRSWQSRVSNPDPHISLKTQPVCI